MLDVALYSLALFFAALLMLAIVHKVRVLRGGQPAAEPLMKVTEWRMSHARTLLVAAAAMECVICVSIVAAPPLGFIALGILAAGYSFDLRRLPEQEPCNCFGGAIESPNSRAAIRRNVGIASVSLAAAVLYMTDVADVAGLSQTTVGAALVLAGFVASI